MKGWWLVLWLSGWAAAEPLELNFLTSGQAAEVLRQQDDFVGHLSPFDRQARLNTAEPVSQQQFLDYLSGQTLNWTVEDQHRVDTAWQSLRPKLSQLHLPGPTTVDLIVTTGHEEGGAAYTRGTAIVLPISLLSGRKLEGLLTHELFHVLSRANPTWRAALYTRLGFKPCLPPAFPAEVQARRITNPDAPVLDWCWPQSDGTDYVPATLSSHGLYKPVTGGMFAYLQFSFWQLPRGELQPILSAYQERYGKNTGYLIHPEEILAEQFVFLVQRKKVPDPTLVENLREWLQQAEKEGLHG